MRVTSGDRRLMTRSRMSAADDRSVIKCSGPEGGSGDVKGPGSGGHAAALGRSRRTTTVSMRGVRLRLGTGSGSLGDPHERALPSPGKSASLPPMSEARGSEEREAGDGSSFGELYRRHWTSLCQYVRRNFGSGPPDPEDVAQQAFERLSGSSSLVDNVGPFLRRTARNLVIDHHRAFLRTNAVMTEISILDGKYADLSPEDVLSSKEELLILNSAIANLPSKERVALLMHRIDGANFTEIAAHLGVSHSGARLLVSRAFERCAGAMEKQP